MKIDLDKASELWIAEVRTDVIAMMCRTSDKTLRAIMRQYPAMFPERRRKLAASLSQKEIGIARKLWIDGQSYSQIGEVLGKTRNAIGGFMSRNRDIFPKRDESAGMKSKSARSKPLPPKSMPRASAPKRGFPVREVIQLPRPLTPSREAAMAYDEARLPYSMGLVDLDTRKCCKWPLGSSPFMFCAEVKASKNYCHHHHARSIRLS